MFDKFFTKQSPLLGALGLGGGIASAGGGGLSVSGGNVDGLAPGNGYIYHTFTSPGTLTISGSSDFEILVVAGGGGGGSDGSGAGGGGGGGGGVVYATSVPLSSGAYPISVGDAGAKATSGGDSTFHTFFTAKGGGGSGAYNVNGSPGGSGGGAGARASTGSATQPGISHSFPTVNNAGNNGGAGDGGNGAGGGGGAVLLDHKVPPLVRAAVVMDCSFLHLQVL